jgi:hypothetical protein
MCLGPGNRANDAARETSITNLRENPFESDSRDSGMHVRWYAENM